MYGLHYDGRAWTRVPAPGLDGRYGDLNALAATGPQWTQGRWKPLNLPVGDGPEGRVPTDVLTTGRGLTVVGIAPQGEDENGSGPPLPYAVTRR